jgi:hypothetical protein
MFEIEYGPSKKWIELGIDAGIDNSAISAETRAQLYAYAECAICKCPLLNCGM